MKKIFVFIVAAAMVVSLAACGSSSSGSASSAPAAAPAAAASSAAPAAAASSAAASSAAPAATEQKSEAPAATAAASEPSKQEAAQSQYKMGMSADREYASKKTYNFTAEELGEPITFRFNDFSSESNPFGQGFLATKEFVEEASNGNITMEIYWDGSVLGFNDTIQGISEGVMDGGVSGNASTDAVLTLGSVFSNVVKHIPSNVHDVTDCCYRLIQENPEMQEEAINTAGVRWLGGWALFGSNIHAKGVYPQTPEDMKGIAIESLGATSGYFALMGANALTLDPADYYLSLERGIIDAQCTHWPAVNNYQLTELTDYHLLFGENGGGIFFGFPAYFINAAYWDKLTPAQQTILWDGFRYGSYICSDLDYPCQESGINICADDGDGFYYLKGDELQPWLDYVDQFQQQWIDQAEAKGVPGKKILDTLQEYLSEYD